MLTRLVVFDKHRAGELTKIPSASFINKPDWTQGANQEITNSLTAIEHQYAKGKH